MPEAAALRVLVVDDEKNIRHTVAVCLEGSGCTVTGAESAAAARAAVAHGDFDLAFLDLRLGDDDGLALLPELLSARPGMAVVVITAYATIETAVEAIRRGASEYLPKPFTPAQLRHVVEQVAARRALTRRVAELEAQLAETAPELELDSAAPAMRAVLDVLPRVAASDASVLLRGENGTGKGVFARQLHRRSGRAAAPFVTVNCPTLHEDLLAAELFGHARGAFTGAVRDQPGRVEAADGGTLFLDEIGEISPPLQAKLLRFLQDREFERLGENTTRTADVRVVAATNRDLEADVRDGRFREDLLYRLNVVELRLPALRERAEDIPRLAAHFLAFFARAAGRPVPTLSAAAAAALCAYRWPGNVRELRNAIERALILWSAPVLEPAAFPERIAAAPVGAVCAVGGDLTLEALERAHIEQVVARCATLDEAAQALGIDASTLYRKRRRYEGGDDPPS